MGVQLLNTIGLLLDIAGVCLVFRYGWPQPDLNPRNFLALSGDMAWDEETARKRMRYGEASTFGLSLLVLGFVLQIIATWLWQ